MDVMQTGELLARIQVHDNRKLDELVIEEWHLDLADVDFHDALEAVRAHRRLPDPVYLTIGHVLAGVRRIRAKRLEGFDANELSFPGDPDDIQGYLAWRRGAVAAVASGGPPVTAPVGELISRPMPQLQMKRPPAGDG